MNSINVIIQSTKTDKGLAIEYSNFGIAGQSEVKDSLSDERDIPSKAGDKDAFSIQILGNYKIYSLINGIVDIEGRPGFVAFKLYCRRNKNIRSFETVLNEIKFRYYSNSSLSNPQHQNYDEIISKIVEVPGIQNVLTINKQGKYFCYYDNNLPNLHGQFDSDLIYAVDKLYAFEKPNEEQSEIAELKSITSLEKKIEKTIIKGDLNLINEIKINKQKVDFDPYQEKVTVLLRENENMAYAISQKALTQKNNNEVTISKKPVVAPKPKESSPSAWIFILGLLLGLIFGAGACYYFFPNTIYQEVTQGAQVEDRNEFPADAIVFTEDNGKFKTTHPAFVTYTFKYDDGKWTYAENTNPDSYQDFYISTLENFKYDNKEISKDSKENFIKNLKSISDHDLLDKAKEKKVEVKTSKPITAPKASETTEKKVAKSDKKEVAKPTNQMEPEGIRKLGSKKPNDK